MKTMIAVLVAACLLATADARLGAMMAGSPATATDGISSRALAQTNQDDFNAMLAARLKQLARSSCHTVPAMPAEHALAWGYDLGVTTGDGARDPLPPLVVHVGDVLAVTTHEHNPNKGVAGHKHGKKSWAPNLLVTHDAALYDACTFEDNAAGWTRLLWGSAVLKHGAAGSKLLITEEYLGEGGAENTVYLAADAAWRGKWSWCRRYGVRMPLVVKPRATATACEGSLNGLFLAGAGPAPTPPPTGPDPASAAALASLQDTVASLSARLAAAAAEAEARADAKTTLQRTVTALSTQLMLAQTQAEERVRAQGSSGLVSVRRFKGGHAAWADQQFAGRGFAAIHNHGDFMDTLGMGEVEVVMNGVGFRTRHNDFRLLTPSASPEYGAVEPVAMPEVPQAVLDIQRRCPTRDGCVAAQVTEMQAWFQAWKDQDYTSGRDYRAHFRPVLCYLEGAWIESEDLSSAESASDRHEIEADGWADLRAKTRYMMNSGRKNTRENLSQLPSAVRGVDPETGAPIVANFEYVIKCERLSADVPTARFRVARDLQTMLAGGRGGGGDGHGGQPLRASELARTRRARFDVHPSLKAHVRGAPAGPDADADSAAIDLEADASWGYDLATARNDYEYLDTLMEQVWGKDNRGAVLEDVLEGQASRHRTRTRPATDPETGAPVVDKAGEPVLEADILNVARYSRFYQNADKDAMGFQQRRRGYSDRYLWAARTEQGRVSGVEASFGKTKHDDKVKLAQTQRWSYALPLEIVYTTPLTKWNPYNITDRTEAFHAAFAAQPACCKLALKRDRKARCAAASVDWEACLTQRDRTLTFERAVAAGGARDGRPRAGPDGVARCDPATAFDGAKRSAFRRTPASFFAGGEGEAGAADPADTSGGGACVLGADGSARLVRASGHNVFTNAIGGGVGALRQRWPIVPLHAEGGAAWKETKALEALTLGVAGEGGSDGPHHNFETDERNMFGIGRDRKYGVTLELTNPATGEHVHLELPGRKVARMDRDCAINGTPVVVGSAAFDAALAPASSPFTRPGKDFKDLYECSSFQTTNEGLPTDGLHRSVQVARDHATGEYRIVFCQVHSPGPQSGPNPTRRFDGTCGDGFDTLVRA